MKFKTMLTISAIVTCVYAVGALLAPAIMLNIHAITPSPEAQLMVRYFGAALLGYGVLSWIGRKITDAVARRAIVLAFLIFFSTGFIVSAAGSLSMVMGHFGWSLAILFLLLGLDFGFWLFEKPSSQQQ